MDSNKSVKKTKRAIALERLAEMERAPGITFEELADFRNKVARYLCDLEVDDLGPFCEN